MEIVIISSVSFPNLSPRAHRTTELAKEFARQGHDVVMYALLGSYDYKSFSNTYGVVCKNLGKPKLGYSDNLGHRNESLFLKVIRYSIGKYFLFPDIELIPMVKKAIKNEGNIDMLITIAVPHIIHFATAKSDISLVKTWIADCGDPFMFNKYINPPQYFEKMERKWCEKCNFITVPIEDAKDAYYQEYREKIKVIPQGFCFDDIKLSEYKPNPILTFAYSGMVYKGHRDPSKFLEYLCGLDVDFRFIIYSSSKEIYVDYVERLGEKLVFNQRVDRETLLQQLSKMDFLLNISNDTSTQLPSKLIDYGLTQRPILNISSEFGEEEQKVFLEFLRKDYSNALKINNLDNYNITNIVKKMIDLHNSNLYE